jgi:hypothetical protein
MAHIGEYDFLAACHFCVAGRLRSVSLSSGPINEGASSSRQLYSTQCLMRVPGPASLLRLALCRQDNELTKEGNMRVALLCLCALLLSGQSAFAEDKDKLIGAWKIVSAVVEDLQNKEQKPLYGEHPKGYLILLASGRMMSLLVSEGRKAPQTDKERSDAYRTMVAYSGKFTLEGNKPDVAWNEAWLVDQERYFRIEGDKLYIETAPQLNPNFGKLVRVTLVWEREN